MLGCENQVLVNIKVDGDIGASVTVKDLLNEYTQIKKKTNSKFNKLTQYFYHLKKKKITLTISAIEKILGFKLCESAYKYKTYYLSNKKGLISEAWRLNGYEIENIDLDKKEITFKKMKHTKNKVNIPEFIYKTNLQKEVIDEINTAFLKIQKKYRLE